MYINEAVTFAQERSEINDLEFLLPTSGLSKMIPMRQLPSGDWTQKVLGEFMTLPTD